MLQATQYAVNLSLNITTEKDGQREIAFFPLVSLTTLLMWLWSARVFVGRARFEWSVLVEEVVEDLEIVIEAIGKLFVGLVPVPVGVG